MKRTFWFVMLLCLLVPSIAFAAESALHTVLKDGVEVVAYGIMLTLATLLTFGVKYLAAKWKVSIPDAWMTSANVWLDKGIAYAEEWAKNQTEKVPSNEKLDTALGFVLEMTDDKKLVAMGKEKLKKLIESRLSEVRPMELGALAPFDGKMEENIYGGDGEVDVVPNGILVGIEGVSVAKVTDEQLAAAGYTKRQLSLIKED